MRKIEKTVALLIAVALAASCDSLFPPVMETGSDYTSATIGTLKYVPTGIFKAGSAEYRMGIPFRMSEHEITRAQFLAVMGVDPSDPACSSGSDDPVQRVNLGHAIAFCNKLSLREGLEPVYSLDEVADWGSLKFEDIPVDAYKTAFSGTRADLTKNGYRLATQPEWAWAAMGAAYDRSNGYTGKGVNTEGYSKGYAGSTEAGAGQARLAEYAWFNGNSGGRTHPVGRAGGGKPNELGLFDMSGNVREWVWGSYIDHFGWSHASSRDTGDDRSMSHMDRYTYGGSWNDAGAYCRVSAYIGSYLGQDRDGTIGFRVVRS